MRRSIDQTYLENNPAGKTWLEGIGGEVIFKIKKSKFALPEPGTVSAID
jgi:hypothetical protein